MIGQAKKVALARQQADGSWSAEVDFIEGDEVDNKVINKVILPTTYPTELLALTEAEKFVKNCKG